MPIAEDSSELPAEMMMNGRAPITHFAPNELLSRRIPADTTYFDFDAGGIEMDAVELPDMSVHRDLLGSNLWLLIEHPTAGIASFRVTDIPPAIQHAGTTWYTSFAVHRPLRRNWAHTQVEAYVANAALTTPADGTQVDGKTCPLDPNAHYRWRYQLWRRLTLVRRPTIQ